jgi:hypothetical protein
MKEHFKAFSDTVNKCQILLGAAGLLFGALIYLVDRSPDQTYFVYKSSIDISLYNILPNLFGPIGNNLPTFIHVFSFILITAGLISCQKRGYLIICTSWFLADYAFELGQKFNSWPSKLIPDWFAGIPFLENTENYFLSGTFDYFDLTAITIGTIMAYFVLLTTRKREMRYEKRI